MLKTSFVDFEKEKVHCGLYKRQNCLCLSNSLYWSRASPTISYFC